MTIKDPVTAFLTLPGQTHNFALHGRPAVRQAYLRNGVPAVDIALGDHIDGTGPGELPELTITSFEELDALDAAVRDGRARLTEWHEREAAERTAMAQSLVPTLGGILQA